MWCSRDIHLSLSLTLSPPQKETEYHKWLVIIWIHSLRTFCTDGWQSVANTEMETPWSASLARHLSIPSTLS
ncbi:hypothetical protein EPR50_G00071700 [Perca flavescens]|uniref:Uncharacterized protein n=1 Tax=Perca flavescens TaxID=8167 RepID=A0A484D4B3_PERFV|nr:hypothetical protein EPR50_G00071700 [Perca flavescens]